MYTIGEFALIAEVSTKTLRYHNTYNYLNHSR
jgi:DNA-binding transcriptional MerR regulator